MRLPFLQLESDLIAHGAAEVAQLAGCHVAQALGHLALLRAWAVSHAGDDAPPDGWVPGDAAGRRIEAAAQWGGERGALLQALLDAGQVQQESGGLRVLHLEPYIVAWNKNAKAKERMRTARERSANTRESGDERSAKFGGQTQTQTQTQREERRSPQPPKGGEGMRQEEPLAPYPEQPTSEPRDAEPNGWTLPDAIDAVHREVMEGRPYRWDTVHDEKAATVLMSLCASEGIPIPDVPEEAGRRFGRALVRSLWRFERAAGKAVTLRELARRECWSINAEPPRREQEERNPTSGVTEKREVAIDPWDAMLAKREAA